MNGYPDGFKFYQPIHFKIQEFVPPNIYAARGEKSIELMDWRIIYSMDCIREYLKVPLVINTWMWGGNSTMSGFRPPKGDVGSPLSQHKFGRASDFKNPKMPAEEIRMKIIEASRLFPFITYMESGEIEGKKEKRNWVHIDCRFSDHHGIYLFNP